MERKWCEIFLKSEENVDYIGSLKSSQIFVLVIFILSTYLYFVFLVFLFSLMTNYEYVFYSSILKYGGYFVLLLSVVYSVLIYLKLIHEAKYKGIAKEKGYVSSSKSFLLYSLLSISSLLIMLFLVIFLKL